MDLRELLKTMVDRQASDIHLKTGRPPILRVHGELVALDMPPLDAAQVTSLAEQVLGRSTMLDQKNEFDIAYQWDGVARFRANIFRQRSLLTIVMRVIPAKVPLLESLNLPGVLREIATTERGLVLVTGTTGSGKSTTLAGMIHEINRTQASHIVTVEDPIEFIHQDLMSSVCQREVGLDTETFASALRYVLRQDPDVILIGEMRDPETVRAAISAAETGHMVFSTLHTTDSIQSINRIIDFFPDQQQNQVRQQLSMALKSVISQRLLVRAEGSGRIPACEIMLCTPTIRSLIADNKINQIRTFIKDGGRLGMQTFDQALAALHRSGKISREAALANATSPQELELAMKGITSGKASAQTALDGMAVEQSRQAVDSSLEKAASFLRRGMQAEAQAEVKKALLEDPGSAAAKAMLKEMEDRSNKAVVAGDAKSYIKKGLDFYQEDRIDEAVAQWQEALKADPENVQARAYLKGAQDRQVVLAQTKAFTEQGIAAYQAGDLAGALAAWEQAVKADPKNEQAELYLQEGRKSQRALEAERDAKQHFVSGAALYQKGEVMEAALEWGQAIKLNPQYAEAAEYLAAARAHLESELPPGLDASAPDSAVVITAYQAGVKAFSEQRLLQAAQHFMKAKERRPTHPLFGGLADKAKQRHAALMAGLNEKAAALAAQDKLPEALELWRQATSFDPEDPSTRRNLAEIKPRVDQAVTGLYSQGVEQAQASRHREAIRFFERVLALEPGHEAARRRLEDSKVKYEKLKGILSQMKA